jgi:hypothetical protein
MTTPHDTAKPNTVKAPVAPVAPKKFEAPIGTPNNAHDGIDTTVAAPQDVNVPKPRVSQNVIQPSPTPETLIAEPKQPNHPEHQTQDDIARKDARARGYSIGPNSPAAHIRVKNVRINALNLEAGIIEPGQTGLATDAEVSNLRGQYLEVA